MPPGGFFFAPGQDRNPVLCGVPVGQDSDPDQNTAAPITQPRQALRGVPVGQDSDPDPSTMSLITQPGQDRNPVLRNAPVFLQQRTTELKARPLPDRS